MSKRNQKNRKVCYRPAPIGEPTGHMTQKTRIDRRALSEMFEKGAERKMAEHQLFAMLTVEHPDREPIYHELYD